MVNEKVQKYFGQKRAIQDAAKDFQLSETQLELLLYLGDMEEPIPVCELSKYVSVNQPGVSTAVTVLWRDGLVDKKIDRENQRFRNISINSKGRDVYQNLVSRL